MDNFFDNQRILNLIWNRKLHFVVIGVIAIILSVIFSGPVFITPKFKSTARIYPVNLAVLSEESKTEQMLEVLNSNDIKLKVIEAFNLNEGYNIDTEDPHYLSYMMDIYGESVTTKKTEFETVEIAVLEHDPILASNMCDSLIHFYNRKVRALHRIKDWEMLQIIQDELDRRKNEFDTIQNELVTLRKEYGILDYLTQVEKVTEGYMLALAQGSASSSNSKKIENLYNNLAEKGTRTHWLEMRYIFLIENIQELKTQYDEKYVEYKKDITYSHIVEYPFPADKKSYPVRWLIVSFSTLSAIFFSLLVFLVLDYRKEQ